MWIHYSYVCPENLVAHYCMLMYVATYDHNSNIEYERIM